MDDMPRRDRRLIIEKGGYRPNQGGRTNPPHGGAEHGWVFRTEAHGPSGRQGNRPAASSQQSEDTKK